MFFIITVALKDMNWTQEDTPDFFHKGSSSIVCRCINNMDIDWLMYNQEELSFMWYLDVNL